MTKDKIKQEIKNCREEIRIYEKMIKCKHDFYISEGDNISCTGPTGLYKCCKKCDYKEEIGYVGSNGRIFYEKERKKYQEIFKKAKSLGLTSKEIKLLKEYRWNNS